MPRETVGYTRLEWVCPACSHRNPGPFRFCSSCGAQQPPDVKFEQPLKEELITDEKELAAAKAGADRYCGYCGNRNPAAATVCQQCGGDLTGAQARAAGEVLGAHRTEAAPDQICPACGAPNPANALNCAKCGSSLSRPKTPAPAAPAKTPWWVFAIIGVFLLCLIAGIIAVTRTKDLTGVVQDVSWQRQIAIEGLVTVSRSDWRDEIPSGATVGQCELRVHHTQDQPADNAEKICGTPYSVDQGNGYSQIVQDCTYEVKAEFCQFQAQEWQVVDTAVVSGSDLNPAWPQFNLQTNQRQGSSNEVYKVLFSVDGEQKTYTTSNLSEFQQFQPGSTWTLKVNGLGEITEISQ
jgi:ribosomal protein L40E